MERKGRPVRARHKMAAAVKATAIVPLGETSPGRRSESLFLRELLPACFGPADQHDRADFPRRGIVKSANQETGNSLSVAFSRCFSEAFVLARCPTSSSDSLYRLMPLRS